MSYAPRSLSYTDGLEDGARKERNRIRDLIMSDAHYVYTDMYDTATLRKFTDLLLAIGNEAQCPECGEIVHLDDMRDIGVCYVCDKEEETDAN